MQIEQLGSALDDRADCMDQRAHLAAEKTLGPSATSIFFCLFVRFHSCLLYHVSNYKPGPLSLAVDLVCSSMSVVAYSRYDTQCDSP